MYMFVDKAYGNIPINKEIETKNPINSNISVNLKVNIIFL